MNYEDAVLRELEESARAISGLAIRQRIEARADLGWWTRYAHSPYVTLWSLEQDGLVEVERVEQRWVIDRWFPQSFFKLSNEGRRRRASDELPDPLRSPVPA